MADFPSLKPADIANVTAFFGNGFVFRYALGSVRRFRSAPDLQTLTLSVVVSLCLWAPYMVAEALADGRLALKEKSLQLPCTTALFLAVSYGLGLVWGHLPRIAAFIGWPWLQRQVGTVESQSIVQFLQNAEGKWMRFMLDDGIWYQGMLSHYDGDAERFNDLHIAIVFPHAKDGEAFVKLEGIEEMLLCASEIKAMQVLPIPEAPVEQQVEATEQPNGLNRSEGATFIALEAAFGTEADERTAENQDTCT